MLQIHSTLSIPCRAANTCLLPCQPLVWVQQGLYCRAVTTSSSLACVHAPSLALLVLLQEVRSWLWQEGKLERFHAAALKVSAITVCHCWVVLWLYWTLSWWYSA